MIFDEKEKLKLRSILAQRISSLCKDGYSILFHYQEDTTNFMKLRHKSNGSVITLAVSIADNFMVQKSNGVKVYSGKIQP